MCVSSSYSPFVCLSVFVRINVYIFLINYYFQLVNRAHVTKWPQRSFFKAKKKKKIEITHKNMKRQKCQFFMSYGIIIDSKQKEGFGEVVMQESYLI